MTFDKRKVVFGRGKYNNIGSEEGLVTHSYVSSDDTQAQIAVSGYFNDFLGGTLSEVKVGDLLLVRDSASVYENYKIDSFSPMTISNVSVDNPPETGSFVLNMTGGFVGTEQMSVDYVKNGTVVALKFNTVTIAQTGSSIIASGADFPTNLRPSAEFHQYNLGYDDNTAVNNSLTIIRVDGSLRFSKEDGLGFSGAGNLILEDGCLTYIV